MNRAFKSVYIAFLSTCALQSRQVSGTTKVVEVLASDVELLGESSTTNRQLQSLEAKANALQGQLLKALEFDQRTSYSVSSSSTDGELHHRQASHDAGSGVIEALREEGTLMQEAAELHLRMSKFFSEEALQQASGPGFEALSKACRMLESVHDFRAISQLSSCYTQLHNIYAANGDALSSRRISLHVYQSQQLAALGFSPMYVVPQASTHAPDTHTTIIPVNFASLLPTQLNRAFVRTSCQCRSRSRPVPVVKFFLFHGVGPVCPLGKFVFFAGTTSCSRKSRPRWLPSSGLLRGTAS